jgi:benzil reductase ((S)-benzoin forming)
MNILITGTNTGLGFGLAKKYLELGHTVYGINRKLNEELKHHERFKFLFQDISRFSEIETNVESFLKEVRVLELVILNAGILKEIKDLKDTSLEEIFEVMNVNVWSNKVLIDVLFKKINSIKQVVAISSGASVSGSRGWNAYSLSKATLNMLINLYAQEHNETHFCALAPGLIKSNMQNYIYDFPENEHYPVVDRLKKARESGEMPEPLEAAEMVAKAIAKAREFKSGSYLDARNITPVPS